MDADKGIFNIIIGTAGHIDHGKSTLVRKLTGINPDRLPEEKERGLTIDLGFAPFKLSDGRTVGIIDVPGHEKFIKNMAAGSTAVDMVLFTVACDDGIMQQTLEHLLILRLLDAKSGIVVLTKKDLAPPEKLAQLKDAVAAMTKDTFLQDAPVVAVSATTGEGIDELISAINTKVASLVPRKTSGIFRMPVQRVFALKGHGTVITGVPVSGSLAVGDTIELLPSALKSRVRGLQAYRQTVTSVRAGHSSALNVPDIDLADAQRGFVAVTPGFLKAAKWFDARFTCADSVGAPLENGSLVRIHIGTAEIMGELRTSEGKPLAPGSTAFARFKLEEPVIATTGDRFIVRMQSPAVTVGGGMVLKTHNEAPRAGLRLSAPVLQKRLDGLADELAYAVALAEEHAFNPPSEDALYKELLKTRDEYKKILSEMVASGRAILAEGMVIPISIKKSATVAVKSILEADRKRNPISVGLTKDKIARFLKMNPRLLDMAISDLGASGVATGTGGVISLGTASTASVLTSRQKEVVDKVTAVFKATGMNSPRIEEALSAHFKDKREVDKFANYLVHSGDLVRLSEEIVVHKDAVELAKETARRIIAAKGELTPRDICDGLKTSRKYAIPILEHLDKIGVTVRDGNRRVLKTGGAR